jgi:hypothetical protein
MPDDQAVQTTVVNTDTTAPAGNNGQTQVPQVAVPVKRWKIEDGCPGPISAEVKAAADTIQSTFKAEVWFLSTGKNSRFKRLDETCTSFFAERRDDLQGKRIAIVVDSLGGYGHEAYEIARMIQRRCAGFVGIVPNTAKSAATMLLLGTESIYMAADAQLGPIRRLTKCKPLNESMRKHFEPWTKP